MSRLSLVTAISVAILCGPITAASAQDPGSAKVVGAEVVNVREGPGLDHPVIGVLRRDQMLAVEDAGTGQWIHIRSGDLDGFVNGHFLELAATPRPTVAATPPLSPLGTPPPTATVIGAPPGEDGAGGAAAPEAAGADLPGDIDRILSLTEAMHRDVKMLQTLQVSDPPRDGISGLRSGLGLLLLGAVIGFVVGNIFGRQQERGTRGRVRF